MIVPESEWPSELRHAAVRGVFVGGCVSRGDGSRFRRKAHAHIDDGPHQGWICLLSARRLTARELLLHELAHLVVRAGHTDEWRAALLALGGTLDPVPGLLKSYQKHVRRPASVQP